MYMYKKLDSVWFSFHLVLQFISILILFILLVCIWFWLYLFMILFMYYIYYVHVQVLFICSNIECLIEKNLNVWI